MARYDTEYGRNYGKYDLERIGLFGEMSYMNGKGYVSTFSTDIINPRAKGLQMIVVGAKTKTGLQDCYFEKEFHRIFEKEAWKDPVKQMHEDRMKFKKKMVTNVDFMPSSCTKKHSGPGDYYGTISGTIEAFSPVLKTRPAPKKELPNFVTNPGKKGGPGYGDVCFSKYPEHSIEKYDGDPTEIKKAKALLGKPLAGPFANVGYSHAYFDNNPNRAVDTGPHYVKPKSQKPAKIIGTGVWIPSSPAKKDGGCKAGTINTWPEHLPEATKLKTKVVLPPGVFYPQARNKTMYTHSVLNRKIDVGCNATNWRNYQPTTFSGAS